MGFCDRESVAKGGNREEFDESEQMDEEISLSFGRLYNPFIKKNYPSKQDFYALLIDSSTTCALGLKGHRSPCAGHSSVSHTLTIRERHLNVSGWYNQEAT